MAYTQRNANDDELKREREGKKLREEFEEYTGAQAVLERGRITTRQRIWKSKKIIQWLAFAAGRCYLCHCFHRFVALMANSHVTMCTFLQHASPITVDGCVLGNLARAMPLRATTKLFMFLLGKKILKTQHRAEPNENLFRPYDVWKNRWTFFFSYWMLALEKPNQTVPKKNKKKMCSTCFSNASAMTSSGNFVFS